MTLSIKTGLMIAFIFAFKSIWSQTTNFTKSDYWKRQREEIFFGVGAANILGDLGGMDRIGTDYSLADLEMKATRPSFHIGYRWRFKPWVMTKSKLQYSLISGSDLLTNEAFRRYRNLSYRTHVIEFSQYLEFIVYNAEFYGRRYKIRELKGWRHTNTLIYLIGGVSGFCYMPQSKFGGSWHNLRPLKTEGQGLPGAAKPYGLFNFGVPCGVGVKIGIDLFWRIGIDLVYQFTFTDYLDDVSGDYYDNQILEDEYGSLSAYFADPSSGEHETWTSAGEMRGDPDQRDGLLYLNVSLVRNISDKGAKKLRYQYRAKF